MPRIVTTYVWSFSVMSPVRTCPCLVTSTPGAASATAAPAHSAITMHATHVVRASVVVIRGSPRDRRSAQLADNCTRHARMGEVGFDRVTTCRLLDGARLLSS